MPPRFSRSGQGLRSCVLTSTPVMLVPLVPESCLEEREGLGELSPLQMGFAPMLFLTLHFLELQEDLL